MNPQIIGQPQILNKKSQIFSRLGSGPSLSIIVPFFNEEESVPQLRDRLLPVIARLRARFAVELILVDDGSSDSTHDLLRRHFPENAADARVILRHPANRGISAAMRTGFESARGQLVCTLDCDCTYAPEELVDMIDRLQREGADIVTASPYHPAALTRESSRRLFLSRACSRLYRRLMPEKLYCYTCFFRVMRSPWARPEMSGADGFLGVTEHLLTAAWCGAVIAEHPARLGVRRFGRSKMRTLQVIRQHLGLLGQTLALRARLLRGGLRSSAKTGMPLFAMAGAADAGGEALLGRLDFLGSYRLDPSLTMKLGRVLELRRQAQAA